MRPRPRRALVVAALAAALPASALAEGEHDATQHAGDAQRVVIRTTALDPPRTTVLVGETVDWLNVSFREHTVTSDDGLFDSGTIGPNRRFSHTFAGAGSFAYHCRIHPTIRGVVHAAHVLLHASAGSLVRGDELVLEGRTGPGAGPVAIEREIDGGFAPVASVARAPDGSFSARLAADETASYRASADGFASAPVRVEVAPARTLRLTTVRARRRQLVRVAVDPALPGGSVHLQRHLRERFGWWTIRRARLAHGRHATIALPRGSRAPVRIVLTRPDGETRVAVSRIVRLPG